MAKIMLIMLGGAIGSGLRYAVAGWMQRLTDDPFPVGTMTVNVAGCLVIGVLGFLFAGPVIVREEYRFMILVGVLGGFTTFSSFGFETLTLVNDGQMGRAMLNVVLNNALGLAAVWIGFRLTERIVGGAA